MEQSREFIDEKKVKEAATALVAYHKSKRGDDGDVLFGVQSKVQLQISVWRITTTKSKTHQIKLPHRPHAGEFDVCLFARDEPKMDPDQCQAHLRDKLRSQGVTCITEVIPLKMLKKEYIPFEARRRLARSYNLFLADARIFRLLHSSLGKEFYKRNRYPVTVNLEKKDLKTELDCAVNSTYIIMTHRGTCSNVNVGNMGMSAQELTDNTVAATASLGRVVPGGWPNVKSIFVRSERSVSLPIYASLVHADWEEGEGGGDRQTAGGDGETRVDNSDITRMKRQLRLEADLEGGGDESDDDAPAQPKKAGTKRRKATGGKWATPGKLAKKSKRDHKGGAGARKPAPKVGGKKKK